MKILYKLNVAAASASMVVLMAAGSAGAISGRDGTSSSGPSSQSTETSTVATSTATTAETETSTSHETTDDSKAAQSGTESTAELTRAEKDAKKQADKLAKKVKLCQKHEGIVKNTASRIADRAQKHLDLFTTIATRTETFYTAKGKTLANYGALVDDVNAKKAVAQAAVDVLVAEAPNVTCDDTGVISASAATFKVDAKKAIAALKEYKTAVKNLIVGVKSVQSESVESSSDGGSN